MTTQRDALVPGLITALVQVHKLDRQEPVVLQLMDADSDLALDDSLSGDFPVSTYTFGQLWRANQRITSCLRDAGATDGTGPRIVEELPHWAGLLKEALEQSALAWWVLGPVDSRTRVTRRLELAMYECRELRRALQSAHLPTAQADDAAACVHRVALAAKLRVQARYPLTSALDYADRIAVPERQLAATHALIGSAGRGSRDALRQLGALSRQLPGTRRTPVVRPEADAGFALAVMTTHLLLTACHERFVHLRSAPVELESTLRGAV
jgi:hypothetical protein